MTYCGFSDSSSDDNDGDDDMKQTSIATNTDIDIETETDWINAKAQPMQQLPSGQEARRIKPRHTFNSILAPQSLADIKEQIVSKHSAVKQQQEKAAPPPPPPLQSLSDNRNIKYNHKKQQYKIKRKPRTNLTIKQHIPKSKHLWLQHPIITGVSAQVSIGIKVAEFPFFKPVGIKLFEIIHVLRNVVYRPEEFVAIRMRLRNPKMSVTIFSNGKLTTQGGKSEHSCVFALRKVARMLQQIGEYKTKIRCMNKPIFYGIQSNAHFGYKVDLQKMSESYPNRVEYSPDLESAYLKFRQPLKYGDKGSCHVYHSGRVTILGCRSVQIAIQWINDMFIHSKPYFVDNSTQQQQNDNGSNRNFRDIILIDNNNNNTQTLPTHSADTDSDPMHLFDGIAPPPLLN